LHDLHRLVGALSNNRMSANSRAQAAPAAPRWLARAAGLRLARRCNYDSNARIATVGTL